MEFLTPFATTCYLLFLLFSLPPWSLRVSSSKMLYISINALALVILSSFGYFFWKMWKISRFKRFFWMLSACYGVRILVFTMFVIL